MQKHKRGDLREDGMVFYHYTNTGEEYWVSKDKFEKYKINERIRNKNRKRKKLIQNGNHITSGTIREDGMVFLRYSSTCKNGEYWVTQEKFNQYRIRQNTGRKNERYRNKNKLRNREYRKINRKKHSDYNKRYYKKNTEKIKQKLKQYIKNNPSKIRIWSNTRRSRLKKCSIPLSENQKKIIECLYVQADRLQKIIGIRFHVDHIVPIKLGGLHIPSNLQVMPAKLNQRKGSNDIFKWSEKN